MISMKKISPLLLLIVVFAQLNPMDAEKQRKLENKKIRRELRDIQAKAVKVTQETEILKNSAKCKNHGVTLSSHDGKNQLVTINFKDGSFCYRKNKEFIELWQEKSSDEDIPNDTFDHPNREDGPDNNDEECIKKDKKSKKCCCFCN